MTTLGCSKEPSSVAGVGKLQSDSLKNSSGNHHSKGISIGGIGGGNKIRIILLLGLLGNSAELLAFLELLVLF